MSEHEAQYDYEIPSNPADTLPFAIDPQDAGWEFAPEYYPDRLPQSKDRDLNRDAVQCSGEDVSIKAVKNREFHVSGVILAREVPTLQQLIDYEGKVDLITPISPSGGTECFMKNGEVDANPDGWDGFFREWRFSYTLDLVSTGYDEYDTGNNAIVSSIISGGNE